MSKNAADKIRNSTPEELKHQEREHLDQLFRLKFQMKMGQSESLNKIRSLRRNVARIKTFRRQHELGISVPAATQRSTSPKAETQAKVAGKKKVSTKTKAARKKTAGKAGKK